MTEIYEAQNYLDSVSMMNNGGCGIAAIAMKRWMRKNKNKNVNIIFGFSQYSENLYQNNCRAIAGLEDGLPSACTHAGFKLKGEIYDSNGKWSKTQFKFLLPMPEKIAVAAVNDFTNWNIAFSRSTHVPRIAKTMDIDLSDIWLVNPAWREVY